MKLLSITNPPPKTRKSLKPKSAFRQNITTTFEAQKYLYLCFKLKEERELPNGERESRASREPLLKQEPPYSNNGGKQGEKPKCNLHKAEARKQHFLAAKRRLHSPRCSVYRQRKKDKQNTRPHCLVSVCTSLYAKELSQSEEE